MKPHLWRALFIATALVLGLLALTTFAKSAAKTDDILLNASFDATRALYDDINKAFADEYLRETGRRVVIRQSHGGSGKQARTIADGLPADIASLALSSDIDMLAKRKLIAENWRSQHENNSIPYSSLIVFVVREGNPKNIRDWSDLANPGVRVVTPNPKTSGGARWNYLAAWGARLHATGGDEQAARQFVTNLFRNANVLDTSARGSAHTFVRRGHGDVLLAWESEAILLKREFPKMQLQVIYPSETIVAETPVAIVDLNVDRLGTRKLADRYIRFLYSPAGQRIITQHHFRPYIPRDGQSQGPAVPPLPEAMKTFTIGKVFGGWPDAQKRHFASGSEFDRMLDTLTAERR